jgi:hypothetical protein
MEPFKLSRRISRNFGILKSRIERAEKLARSSHLRRASDELSGAEFERLLETLQQDLSPDKPTEPSFIFDPASFEVTAHLIAMTLLAQKLTNLDETPNEYGSGVYALYYIGSLPYYRPIRKTNFPIYVGSAKPQTTYASRAQDQGEALAGRLADHLKSIRAVERYRYGNLSVKDFRFRYLCVRSGWELAAEQYLIHRFQPVWNIICSGIGKHGDESKTRQNNRSIWDTIHRGRPWTLTKATKPNRLSSKKIITKVSEHFRNSPPETLNIRDVLT